MSGDTLRGDERRARRCAGRVGDGDSSGWVAAPAALPRPDDLTGPTRQIQRRALVTTTLILSAAALSLAQASAAPGRLDARVARALDSGAPVAVVVHLEASPAVRAAGPGSGPEWIAARSLAVREQLAEELPQITAKLASPELAVSRIFSLQTAFAATVNRSEVQRLLAMDAVRHIEEDSRWPLHTLEGLQVINAHVLHRFGITGDDTAIAIIDTGVDYLHPTLGGGMIPNAKVVRGLDTADQDDDPMDCSGHGTAVASIAAGASYQWSPVSGFSGGVAPDAHILAYKASNTTECDALVVSAVVAAIEDAILHRDSGDYQLAAINISAGAGSFTGPCDSAFSSYGTAVDLAVAAGIAVVASAGNQGITSAMSAPACLSNVISVASVWDTDAGLTPFSFCLDEGCTDTCNDSFKPARSVVCYSNTSPYLDLLAPSEYLVTAHASGQTTSFGGTSGAAPYVAGSIALLHDAHPQLDPVHARFVLALKGMPVFDPRSGAEFPLLDLEAALDERQLAIADDTNVAIPTGAASVLRSQVHVQDDGRVGFVKVQLKIVHPDPTLLQIRLVAPDGTMAVLHDRGTGTTPTPDAVQLFAGIFADYPDTTTPVEGLGRFANAELRGEWVLEVEAVADAGGDPGSSGRLIGWALQYGSKVPPDPLSGEALHFPITARAAGVNGTFWRSDLLMFNPSATRNVSARMYLVAAGSDGALEFEQRELELPISSLVPLPDVLLDQFRLSDFQGQLIIQSDAPLVASSRIFTMDADSGSYGQYVGATTGAAGIAVGESELILVHLASSEDFRTNIGFAELSGSRAWVEFELLNGDSRTPLAQATTFSVEPFSNLQVNDVFAALHAPNSENAVAVVRVSAGSGRVAAYASVVDNRSGDAMFIPGDRPQSRDSWVVPVVAYVAGEHGTEWVSDLRLYNHDSSTAEFELSYRPRGGDQGAPRVRSVTVQARSSLQLDNVLSSVFEMAASSGSLRIHSPSRAVQLIASSRTYNRTGAGSFGQHIPAVNSGLGEHAVLMHLSSDAAFRSNVGLCEVSGSPVQLELTMVDDRGHLVGSLRKLSLEPWELHQINDVHRTLGVPATTPAVLHVRRVGGDGEFTAYSSVVDGITGDAIFAPGAPVTH